MCEHCLYHELVVIVISVLFCDFDFQYTLCALISVHRNGTGSTDSNAVYIIDLVLI